MLVGTEARRADKARRYAGNSWLPSGCKFGLLISLGFLGLTVSAKTFWLKHHVIVHCNAVLQCTPFFRGFRLFYCNAMLQPVNKKVVCTVTPCYTFINLARGCGSFWEFPAHFKAVNIGLTPRPIIFNNRDKTRFNQISYRSPQCHPAKSKSFCC